MAQAVLITGGNTGNPRETLRRARALIGLRVGEICKQSRLRITEPWGVMETGAENFLNQVLVVQTSLTPTELLEATQQIERELGRGRTDDAAPVRKICRPRRYSSRPIDIDILFYDDLVMDTPALTIPHPLIDQREFVLEPLAHVMPAFRHPVTGKTMHEMLYEYNTMNVD